MRGSDKLAESLGTIRAEIALQIENVQKGAKEVKNVLKSMAQTMADEARRVKSELGDAFESIEVDAGTASAGLVGAGTAIAGSMIAMGAGAIKTEKTFKKFEAQTGLSGKELQNFNSAIEETYLNNFGEDLADVSETFQKYQRALNLSAKETQELTEGSYILKDLYEYEIEDTLNANTQLMKNFGITGKKSLDIITESARLSGDRAGDLLDTFGEYSQQFSKMGFSAEEFAGMLVKGLQNGQFNTDQLGDSVKEFGIVLLELAKENDDSLKKVIGNSKQYKKIVSGLKDGSVTVADAMKIVNSRLKDSKDELSKNQLGVSLYGTLWEEVGGDVITSLTDSTAKLKNFDDANKKAGETMYGNNATMEQAGRQFKKLADTIGKEIAPYLIKAINFLSKFLSKLMEFMKANPVMAKIAVVIGVVVSVISSLIGVIIILYPYIQTAITVFGILASVIGGVISTIGAMIAAVGALPIIIVAAIIALVALIIWKWDEVKSFTIKIWTAIIDFFKALPDTLKTLWTNILEWIKTAFNNFNNTAKNLWKYILDYIKTIPDKLYNFFTATLPFFIGFVVGLFVKMNIKLKQLIISFFLVTLPKLVSQGLTAVKNFFTKTLPSIILAIGKFVGQAYVKWVQFKEQMKLKALEAVNGFYNYIKSLPGKILSLSAKVYSNGRALGSKAKNGILDTFKNLPDKMIKSVQDAINGIGRLGSQAYSALKRVGSNMWEGFKKGMGIHSPSYIEKAMFKIQDEGLNLKESLIDDFRKLRSLPQLENLVRLARGNTGTTNNNTRNIQTFNAPLVSVQGTQTSAGIQLSSDIYEEVIKKIRGGGTY